MQERDNLERAVECYMTALSIRPNFPQSLNNLGVVYTAQASRAGGGGGGGGGGGATRGTV